MVLIVNGTFPTVLAIPPGDGPAPAEAIQQLQKKFDAVEVSVDGPGRLSRVAFGGPLCWPAPLDRAYEGFVTHVWPLIATASGLSTKDTFDARIEPWGPGEHPLGFVVVLQRRFEGFRVLHEEMHVFFQYDLYKDVEEVPLEGGLLGLSLTVPKGTEPLCLKSIHVNLTPKLDESLKGDLAPTISA